MGQPPHAANLDAAAKLHGADGGLGHSAAEAILHYLGHEQLNATLIMPVIVMPVIARTRVKIESMLSFRNTAQRNPFRMTNPCNALGRICADRTNGESWTRAVWRAAADNVEHYVYAIALL